MSISSPTGSPSLAEGMKGLIPELKKPKRKKPVDKPVDNVDNNSANAGGHPAQTISDQLIVDPTLQDNLDQLKDERLKKSLISWVKEEYTRMKGSMDLIRQQWYLNHAFYRGRQYAEVYNGKFMTIPQNKNRVRLTVNRIEPIVRTEVARMTAQDPNAEVVPATNETQDVESAKAAEALIQSSFLVHKLKDKFNRTAFWTSVCGVGYLKTFWDGSTPVETMDEQGQKGISRGDVDYQVVLPFNLLIPDDTQQDIEDQPYVFNVYTKPVSWVNQRWGDQFENKRAEATVLTSSELIDASKLNNYKTSNSSKPDSCLVVEAWIKPGHLKDLPNGGMITVVNNDTIVQAVLDGFPYSHGEYPFAKIESIPTGMYFSSSVIESLIPLQRELNRQRSQRLEAGNIMGEPGLMYRRGSIDPQKVTNRPGELLEVMPGTEWPIVKPQAQKITATAQDAQELQVDFEDISGQHQVSKGSAPSGVTAATAIQYLSEQDNTYMSTVFDSVESAMQKTARQTIQLFAQYAQESRLIKVGGRNNVQSLRALKGADVRGATDVRVEAGSSMPTSRAAFVAMVTDFMTRGFIDPQMGFELMSLPNFQTYFDVAKLDESQALRENVKFEQMDIVSIANKRAEADKMKYMDLLQASQQAPEAPEINSTEDLDTWALSDPQAAQIASQYDQSIFPINDFDDHEVHIDVHNRFRKSQTYESMPEAMQTEIDRHVDAHENARMQKMLQEQMLGEGMMPGEASDMIGNVNDQSQEGQTAEEEGVTEESAAGGNQFSDTPPQNTSENEKAQPSVGPTS